MAIKIKIRLFLGFLLAGAVFFLFWMVIVPFGKISYVLKAGDYSDFLSQPNPETRVVITEDYFKIIGDPIYFNLRTTRNFEKARLIIKYKKKNIDSPIVEAGIMADKLLWRYDLKPLENKILDDFLFYRQSLFPDWGTSEILREDNLILIQKEKKYSSIKDFLTDPPSADKVAAYNYNLKSDYILSDYQAGQEELELNYKIQGSFQFYTYIKDENLDWQFQYRDLNKNKTKDPVVLLLYYENNLIHSVRADEKTVKDGDQGDIIKTAAIDAENLPEGAYKIEFKASDDIITEKIKTKQQKISFINKIHFFNEDSSLQLFTNMEEIKLKVIDPAYLQTINFAGSELEIKKTYNQFSISKERSENSNLIELEKGGVILEGRGVFYFNNDHFISPSAVQLNSARSINENIAYILADYVPPSKSGEWTEAMADFDLSKAFSENKKYGFLLSIPGLKADDEIDDWLEIGEIKIELEGKTLWDCRRMLFWR